ncbi:hypothetical protein EZV62_012174 [Acer yangbiense]|uniref:CCHC-type domain-containing protein n=1 Tax=Acer yangbiense TaxID=1000413 RepID=A0A5C7HUN0_9ROSI|nr:hypothetical protein EZV62_012174 [Acer yangbiense]
MSANEIARLCENLSIEDADGAIHEILEVFQQAGVEDLDHCLVGKVLSGKKVNREAFKSVIEQLWSPFGQVEIEKGGENTFMFYFNKLDDWIQVWQRGPWYFDKCLLALEKPEGIGEIAKLRFNMAKFWVQIHDISIMCKNRRTARWLAEQIGKVIEIPTDSKECCGKFLRVKIQVDISKPQKRYNIVVVGLKYERLSKFCNACGRVGHRINECQDEVAEKEATEGTSTKFGSWLRAPMLEKLKSKSYSQVLSGSTDRTSQKGESSSAAAAAVKKAVKGSQETLQPGEVDGPGLPDRISVDGPSNGPSELSATGAQVNKEMISGPSYEWLGESPHVRNLEEADKKGFLLLWKDSLDVSILSFSSGHIDARIQSEDGYPWRFSGFYGDPNPKKRVNSWTLLRRLREVDRLPWVYSGDFNEVLSQNENCGGSEKVFLNMLLFRQAVEDCDLIDLGYSGPRYMWNNMRKGRSNIQERLDRVLADNQWRDMFQQIRVDHLGFITSDHRPLLLKCDSSRIVLSGNIEIVTSILVRSKSLSWLLVAAWAVDLLLEF